MSIEDNLLRFEGLDPAKINAILDNVTHLLGVVKAEMPRVEKLIADVQSQIAAYEAKQKSINTGWR